MARPDGKRVYGTFNTENATGAAAAYRSADILEVEVADPVVTSSGGGCTAADGQRPVDPMLPLFAALGLLGWGLRRARRH